MDVRIVTLSIPPVELEFGRHTITITAEQVEGNPVTAGIYIAVAGPGYDNRFTRIGTVYGEGSATYEIEVGPQPTAPQGPVYVTITWGIGLYDPFDHTARFATSIRIDGKPVPMTVPVVDMRTAPQITLVFKAYAKPPEAPPPEEGLQIGIEHVIIAVMAAVALYLLFRK